MSSFSLLHKDVERIVKKLGIKKPTLVQDVAIPKLLNDDNAIIVAPTGAGKTEAAFLPLLSKMLERGEKNPFTMLYITPLRALNRDIFYRLKKILGELGISVEIRHSDTPASVRRKQAENPPMILITTPETLNILLWSPKIRPNLSNVRYVIIDEVHEISDSKRGVQLTLVLERLRRLSKNFQIVLLSATVSNPDEVLHYYTGGKGGIVINTAESKKYCIRVLFVSPKVERHMGVLVVKPDMKKVRDKIISILSKIKGRALIFTNTRDMAEALGVYLRKVAKYKFGVHHSSISRELRVKVERDLRRRNVDAVVATSSLELGIDVGDISHVIQVNSPRRVEVALQRIGRSGHFIDRPSRGTIIAMSIDDYLEALSISMLSERGEVEPVDLIEKSYDVLAHQIIGIVRDFKFDFGRYPSIREVYNIVRGAYPYRNLRYEEFLGVCRFLEEKSRAIRVRNGTIGLTRKSLALYFENLSMIPRSPKYTVVDGSSRKVLGELDEKYVFELNTGSKFILGGKCREVLRIDHVRREVIIKDSQEVSSPPSWIGELLPVSFIVAWNVSNIRSKISRWEIDKLKKFASLDSLRYISKFLGADGYIYENNVVVVEYDYAMLRRGFIVIHACFGDKVNKILGLLIFRIILEQTNLPVVDFYSDPYRIIIRLYSINISDEDIRTAILSAFRILLVMYREGRLKEYIRDTIKRSMKILSWHFLNVARRLGIIRDEEVTRDKIIYLMEKYRDTIAMEEAINEFIYAKTDIKNLLKVLDMMDKGKLELRLKRGMSPLAYPGFMIYGKIGSKEERLMDLEKYKERLMKRRIKWLCLHCGHAEVRRIIDPPWEKCPKCGSMMITISKAFDFSEFIIEKLKRGVRLTPQEKKRVDILFSIGMMLRKYPLRTKLAVATSGANLQQCLNILKHGQDEYFFLETLREIEARFIKSQIFD